MAETSFLLGFISRAFLPADFEDEVLRSYYRQTQQLRVPIP
jgi:hypothetical protein